MTDFEPTYPMAPIVDQIDDFHGHVIPDPYRWLEETEAENTRVFIDAQNRLSRAFLDQIPIRPQVHRRLTELWDYERYGPPRKYGDRYFFWKNDGLQNQSVLYVLDDLHGEPREILDPNALSEDGTVAVTGEEYSPDGTKIAYRVSVHGSDRQRIFIRDVDSGEDLDEVLEYCKFAGIAWLPDSSGFFYDRYPEPEEDEADLYHNNALYFHRLGTPQSDDVKVYDRPDKKELAFAASLTEDDQYVVLYVWHAAINRNRLYYRRVDDDGPFVRLIDEPDAAYLFVGNDGDTFYVQTDLEAPRGRVVAIDLENPGRAAWRTVIPQADGVISFVRMVNDRFVVAVMERAYHRLFLYERDGTAAGEIPLPTMGTILNLTGRRAHDELFISFHSFLFPPTIFRYDFNSGDVTTLWKPDLAFDPDAYVTEQHTYPSRDGTEVTIFVTHRRGLEKNGRNPTLLYGYGGFNISLTPSFSSSSLLWMEHGGVYAVANLRGGGEYGEAWHEGGMLANKQNVFDDFIGAAEWLVDAGYTAPEHLAIHGRSNGGLLTAATLLQRPDLFGAVLCGVPVIDMLRYQRFTAGRYWVAEYGDPDNPDHFKHLIEYSPLHNVTPGTVYPPTLIYTAESDDRVVPMHALKFTAALQAADAGTSPLLLRFDTRSGHGLGKPTAKLIDEYADLMAFGLHMVTKKD